MSSGSKHVVVVGRGGREHALALGLLDSASVARVTLAPGSAALDLPEAARRMGKQLGCDPADPLEVARGADLVVVGPEAPLCAGLVDRLSALGVLTYGPTQQAARLEGSKAFMKQCAERWGISTGQYRLVRSVDELPAALAAFESAPVVKADGLCGGKGVVVAESHEAAREAACRMLTGEAFGDAGRVLVLEERLHGVEVSAHAVCDGERCRVLPFVQDHKRLADGDRGPNTGGMGTYGPVALPEPELAGFVRREVFDKVLAGMRKMGCPFAGTLFANLMLVEGRGPMLLEINVRFGDPETQVLTRVADTDWYTLLSTAAQGKLASSEPVAALRHAVCVVLATPGYPAAPRLGGAIEGLARAAALPGVSLFHAGTGVADGKVVTAGGRVLGVVGEADCLAEAHARAYAAAEFITFDGRQLRRDIAYQALQGS